MRLNAALSTLTAIIVVAAMAVPAFTGTVAAAEPLAIGVTQDASTGNATVTVTDNGSVVSNATVEVTAPNVDYAGEGNYTTDENGTVTLPNPNETVSVDLTATADNQTGTATVELVPRADSLGVDVAQDGETGAVTMTVTQYGVAVPNATVEVAAANVEYAGEGNHTTDENGTVTLDAPTENVTVDVTATAANLTASTTADLDGYAEERIDVAVEQTDGSVLVTVVDENGSAVEGANVSVVATDGNYTEEGDYVTDANGTVGLDAPAENVTVEVTATWGNLTDTTTADLTVRQGPMTFGQRVSWFVHSLMDEKTDKPFGQLVSEFVTSNNPGAEHRPDHAGPNQDRNTERNQAANNSSVQAGGPENPGNGNGQDKGPTDNPGKSGETGNNGNGPDKAKKSGK